MKTFSQFCVEVMLVHDKDVIPVDDKTDLHTHAFENEKGDNSILDIYHNKDTGNSHLNFEVNGSDENLNKKSKVKGSKFEILRHIRKAVLNHIGDVKPKSVSFETRDEGRRSAWTKAAQEIGDIFNGQHREIPLNNKGHYLHTIDFKRDS